MIRLVICRYWFEGPTCTAGKHDGMPTMEQCVECLALLPAPFVIPDGYDPEQERRRMRQGGCCGSPAGAVASPFSAE